MVGVHVVITDSGLGGLSVCAELERRLRCRTVAAGARLTYVNAWPEEGRGYNDLPGVAERAAVFDRALASMAGLAPDRIVIACNTLSILFPMTTFAKRSTVPVQGIVDAGVDLFVESLEDDPSAGIVLLGTRTTIESGVHRDAIVARGIDAGRVASVSCHGLATAIEREADGPRTAELVARCAEDVRAANPAGSRVWVGLCCTHYGYVAERLERAIGAALGREARALDPNRRLVDSLRWPGAPSAGARAGVGAAAPATNVEGALAVADAGGAVAADEGATGASAGDAVAVQVVSKVTLTEATRSGIAGLVRRISPATAAALMTYSLEPRLF